MAHKLIDNLTSSYFEAAHSLYSNNKRQRIIVYVESYEDVAFWRYILSEYEDDNHYFEVMLPSQDTLAKGKKTVLINSLNTNMLGKNLIACVDSDYDFLLQGKTRTSNTINRNKYIFQTYAYAIENYQCYADSLHEICVQATLNDHNIFDFKTFIKSYSEIVYPLFLWSIWFYRQNDTHSFPMYDFNNCARFSGEMDINDPEKSLLEIEKRVKSMLHRYEARYPNLSPQIIQMGKELEPLGLTPTTTYLYIQGHHIMDNIVMKLLTPVCTFLRKERENDIRRLAEHEEQYRNEITCYDNSQTSIEFNIRKNTSFQTLFSYQWLRDDLAVFMDEVLGKTPTRHG